MSDSFDARGSLAAPGAGRRSGSLDPPAPALIVGLGNEIAGDDGIGIHVANVLRRRLAGSPLVDVVALPWAGFALLDIMRGRHRVAIVDCLTSGRRPPGTVVRLDEEGIGGSVRLNSFHDIAFPTVLALGRRMGWDMPDWVAIWGVEAEEVGVFREGLSPRVAAAVEPLIADVLGFMAPAKREVAGVIR
jgi:hydrogenase maturation protease